MIRITWIIAVTGVMVALSALYLMERNDAVGIVILDQLGPDYRAYRILAIGACLCLVISTMLRRRILFARQQMNELAAGELLEHLRTDRPIEGKGFFVYLRSFETTGRLKPPFFFTLAVLQRLHTNELESFLALALAKKGPLLGLGVPGENVGAARIRVEDTTWKADIQRLLTHATGILVVPSAHEGTKWEIEFLQKEALLSKAVFIMPPRTRQFDWRTRWEQAAETLQKFSITLPEYNKRGLLFTVNAQGTVADARVFSLLYRRSIRKSIEKMLSGAGTRCSGPEAIRKANRRSRVIWFFGKWGTSATSLVMLPLFVWFGMSSVFSGRAARGINPPPAWSTFLECYDSAEEVDTGQHLVHTEVLLMKHHELSESQIDQLARKGIVRVGDREREIYVLGLGELLSHSPNEASCAALAEGRASELDRTRTLVRMPASHVTLWMQARQEAALAEIRSRPVAVGDPTPQLREAMAATLGRQVAEDLDMLLTAPRKLTDKETCRLGIEGGAAVYRLQEPYRAQCAAMLAKGPTPVSRFPARPTTSFPAAKALIN